MHHIYNTDGNSFLLTYRVFAIMTKYYEILSSFILKK